MENWGLVTYRETALLWDPKKSSAKAKERVAYVVGHELAHQWFGNLVTMGKKTCVLTFLDWWSELWLNEGFATFVGWLAVDHIFPEWNVFTSFVVGEFTAGVNLDSLRSSHPIEVPVKSPAEINQIFDAISYSKGASVIRMLNRYLGGNVFANGVRSYLKKFAYKNAKTTDLWASLSEASGLDVAAMMHAWTRDVGFPMLTVLKEEYSEEKKEMTLSLEQKRFLSTGDLTPEEEAKSPNWVIPIGVTTLDTKGESITVQLKEKVGTISFPYTKTADSFYKLNANTTGFYRVNYTADQLKRLSAAIAKHESSFSTQDRIGIISDAFAFARAGYGSTIGALELLNGFKHEENQVVLEEIATKLALLRQAWFKDAEAIKGLNALQRAIFSPKVKALGYDYPEGEPQVQVLKRNLVINCAASANDERYFFLY
jgi:aminopeptidase 2